MRGEKEIESAAVQIPNWLLLVTYLGKAMLFQDREEEHLKIVVTSAKSHPEEYMYTFKIQNMNEIGITKPKDIKNLKQFYYYLKFNGECIRFRQVYGEGQLSIQYPDDRNVKLIAHVTNGTRFMVESPNLKERRIVLIKKEQREERQMKEEIERQMEEPLYDKQTLVVEDISHIFQTDKGQNLANSAKLAKKVVIKYCQMDIHSPECEMKNDREIDRLAIQKICKALPQMENLTELHIQWHKLSTKKMIEEIIAKCEGLKNLRVLTFDNHGNAFDNSIFAKINNMPNLNRIQEISCFFNISDQDDYFEQAWWHPENTEQPKGKAPLITEDWETFANSHKDLGSVWIPRNTKTDIKAIDMRPWRKLALGFYEDQQMKKDYWVEIQKIFNHIERENHLVSLCLTRIKDIDNRALSSMIAANASTLQNFALYWCYGESDDGLRDLSRCINIRSICLRHSPLQGTSEVSCYFLQKETMSSTLQALCIENYAKAKENVMTFLNSPTSKNLRSLSLPRNEWVEDELCPLLAKNHEKLIKLNLYNTKLLSKNTNKKSMIGVIGNLRFLRVLNLGATDLELQHIKEIVMRSESPSLPRLRKLNISDRKINRNVNKAFYETNWNQIRYPLHEGSPKQYNKLDNNEKKEFSSQLCNMDLTDILRYVPRVIHLEIRNFGGDERAFSSPKLVPNLRYVGCQFDLKKQIEALQRRGITFV